MSLRPLVRDADGNQSEASLTDTVQMPTQLPIGNATLSASGLTAPQTFTFPNKSGTVALELNDVIVTTNTAVEDGKRYWVNTSGGAITLTIPASVTAGFTFAVGDYSRTFATNNLTINRNGHKIENLTEDLTIKTNGLFFTMSYRNATVGFKRIA